VTILFRQGDEDVKGHRRQRQQRVGVVSHTVIIDTMDIVSIPARLRAVDSRPAL